MIRRPVAPPLPRRADPPPSRRFGSRSAIGAAMLAAVVSTLLAPGARAEYAPGAEPASATATALGDRTSTSPVISRDGRYVAFRTESTLLLGPSPDPGQPFANGFVRKDLVTGAIEPVAPPGADGAASISGDGRYVLFETTLPLVPADANTRRDVYLRDMNRPLTDVGAYELVSSLDGPERSAVYTTAGSGSRAGRAGYGLSADGRTAVFWTDGVSNLPAGVATAPRSQVFVRSLDRDETRLVTRDKSDPTLPGTPVAMDPSILPPDVVRSPPSPQPVLSGDGHVVAWQDVSASAQTHFLPGEAPAISHYLWRDLTAGPAAATPRITGVSDPDDPDCPPDAHYVADELATGPCYGPFASGEAMLSDGSTPAGAALSITDDGRRVLFVSEAKRRPSDPRFQRRGLYLVDMSAGISRKQATREPVTLSKAISDVRPIEGATISGDGRYLVFTSRNNAFDGPRPIGTFQTGELVATNVFVLDLETNGLERATRGRDGSDYLGQLLDPQIGTTDDTFVDQLTVSEDAGAIAFQAADGNLFAGDANAVTDVQVVRRAVTFQAGTVPAPPELPRTVVPEPRVTPLRPVHPVIGYMTLGRGGVASLRVRVPAAGRVSAGAAAGRLEVGRASRRVDGAASVTLRLRPSSAARRALAHRARLRVVVRVEYRPSRGPATRAARGYTLDREALR